MICLHDKPLRWLVSAAFNLAWYANDRPTARQIQILWTQFQLLKRALIGAKTKLRIGSDVLISNHLKSTRLERDQRSSVWHGYPARGWWLGRETAENEQEAAISVVKFLR